MNKYDEFSECPKCGHSQAATTYHSAIANYITPSGERHIPEYLLRTCTRCGAKWREEPLTPDDPE